MCNLEYFLFFVVLFILFFSIKEKFKNLLLLIFSFYIFAYINFKYSWVILFSITFNYFSGIYLDRVKKKKLLLFFSIFINLSLLILLKYFDFFVSNINLLVKFSIGNVNAFRFLFPIGISFFTLQNIGYLVDIYRKDIKPETNFIDFSLFVAYFAKILSGPIERAEPFFKEIKREKTFDYLRVSNGLKRVLFGMFKKLVIADRFGYFIDNIYFNVESQSVLMILIAIFLYSIQLYCDFSGYCDVAIGISNIFGIRLTENFNNPFESKNIVEFWKRWHITLSNWFRDYVFFSLYKGHITNIRIYTNIIIIFLLSGLWHGSSWNFIIWGLIHGVLIVLTNLIYNPIRSFIYKNLEKIKTEFDDFSIYLTYIFVSFSWIFFRIKDVSKSFKILYIVVNNLLEFVYNIITFNIYGLNLYLNGVFQNTVKYLKTINLYNLIIPTIFYFIVQYIENKRGFIEYINSKNRFFRYFVYYFIGFSIIIFVEFFENTCFREFIYFRF